MHEIFPTGSHNTLLMSPKTLVLRHVLSSTDQMEQRALHVQDPVLSVRLIQPFGGFCPLGLSKVWAHVCVSSRLPVPPGPRQDGLQNIHSWASGH